MTEKVYLDDIMGWRSLFTAKGTILFQLFKGDTTFSEIVRTTGVPRKTVAKYLQEFQSRNIIHSRTDPSHKQKIVYSLNPSAKILSRKYFTKTVSELLETTYRAKDKDKKIKIELESSMTLYTKYKIVVFDMDGVLFRKPWENPHDPKVAISSWDSLFKELDIYDEHENMKSIFTKKDPIDYMGWSEAACTLLKTKGLTKRFFDKFTRTRPFINGAKETIRILKESNIQTAIISGSFENLAEYAKNELGIDYIAASCKLKFGDNGLLNNWIISRTDYEDKVKHFKYILKNTKIDSRHAIYVGDDVNDIHVFHEAGLSIAFNASKNNVKGAADYAVNSEDLRDILPYIEKGVMKVKTK